MWKKILTVTDIFSRSISRHSNMPTLKVILFLIGCESHWIAIPAYKQSQVMKQYLILVIIVVLMTPCNLFQCFNRRSCSHKYWAGKDSPRLGYIKKSLE